MQPEDEMRTGDSYAQTILTKWLEIIEIGEKIRTNLMSFNHDPEDLYLYVSKLTRLWLELKPKVVGKKFTTKGLEADFLAFQKYYYDPMQLIRPDSKNEKTNPDSETIFKLEETLRTVLEELHVTEW